MPASSEARGSRDDASDYAGAQPLPSVRYPSYSTSCTVRVTCPEQNRHEKVLPGNGEPMERDRRGSIPRIVSRVGSHKRPRGPCGWGVYIYGRPPPTSGGHVAEVSGGRGRRERPRSSNLAGVSTSETAFLMDDKAFGRALVWSDPVGGGAGRVDRHHQPLPGRASAPTRRLVRQGGLVRRASPGGVSARAGFNSASSPGCWCAGGSRRT